VSPLIQLAAKCNKPVLAAVALVQHKLTRLKTLHVSVPPTLTNVMTTQMINVTAMVYAWMHSSFLQSIVEKQLIQLDARFNKSAVAVPDRAQHKRTSQNSQVVSVLPTPVNVMTMSMMYVTILVSAWMPICPVKSAVVLL